MLEVFDKAIARKAEEVTQNQKNRESREVQAVQEVEEMHKKVSREFGGKEPEVTYKYKKLPLAGVENLSKACFDK